MSSFPTYNRNYMSYVNYAATNHIPVFLCIFIDVIIIYFVEHT